MNDFKDKTSAQLLDIILQGSEQSDEAMFYVLKERVGERLKEKYRVHEHVLFEEFEDVVDDFFLYLREGNGKTREPYHALRSIVNKEAFEVWLVSTFRNYLTNALPDGEMAEALGMSHTHYRVTNHRMKKNVLNFRKRLEAGEQLRLDEEHKAMTKRIDDDFCSLYSTLIHYYNATLQQLKQEPEITALRHKHYNLTGLMLHETEAEYGQFTISTFWKMMDRWLLV